MKLTINTLTRNILLFIQKIISRCNNKKKESHLKLDCNNLSIQHIRIAFDLNKNEPLTQQHLDICEEWNSGKGKDYMKISVDDPRILEYAALYDKLESKKEKVWNQLQLTDI